MHLNPYGADPVRLAVDLANQPPRSVPELARRCQAAGVVMDMPVRDDDLAVALRLVEEWSEIVDATSADERAVLLNRMLASASTYPRLTNHADGPWHLHYRDDGVPLSAVLRALISVGTALHLTSRGMDRLGRCALDGCQTIYADLSRTGRQRYCSPRCANRDAVRRHRARSSRR
ncbi:CGNR zinc finger domain-containing protein [Micromonospora sp. DR5-3]|uniref:CGNR zinc finger domain-containing protein n=1 Tax=unclassified Micromonospora TaxID=2617518 RepID=UPI0011DB4080|nr:MULTISPECIES: CGNR zinc finger domain-containing protein [unclassified Micromonospora]MCW3814328.1 CGNR zinc finger domain-containing protein [Micromonospora sp. DR5-3]TYC23360.1 CGNR zinc finger domain-containing protein [Micromonospora sp. MP36]